MHCDTIELIVVGLDFSRCCGSIRNPADRPYIDRQLYVGQGLDKPLLLISHLGSVPLS